MKKSRSMALILALVLCLCSCTAAQPEQPTAVPPAPSVQEPEPTPGPVPEPIPEPTPEPTPEPSPEPAPPHSELYLPNCTQEQLIQYFEEVVLNMEYTDGTGDATLVQKWMEPIRYRMFGEPTDMDQEVLYVLFEQLNAIPGVPGITAAEEGEIENLSISFLDPEGFQEAFSDAINGETADGAVQFWYYTMTNDIYSARIGYRTDLDQSIRNSILPEEVINGLGLNDTVLREDSITYQYSDANLVLSDVDLLILTLLYHPSIECGMNAESCAAVIRELYY